MGRRLPPLNALRAFDIAARTRTFTAAARELRVSQGAVSRHIAQLEAHLGVALFHRDHREARLTTDGLAYAEAVAAALDRVEQATQSLLDGPQRRALRLKLFPSVAIKWLIARLAEFHAGHPEIDVRLTTTASLVRLDPVEDDFTIQIGTLPQAGIQHDPLIAVELIPVCAPGYLRRAGQVEHPTDLLRHVLVSSIRRQRDWQVWFQGAGVRLARSPSGSTFANSAMAYQAAIDGMGIVMAQKELVRDDLAGGRLVPAYPLYVPNGETYYLASAEHCRFPDEAAEFRQWILSRSSLPARSDLPATPPMPIGNVLAP
jgi:LysR family transcriptional regulator, glycine cleavage system transcriptional activator